MSMKPWEVQYMYETDKNKRKMILDEAVAAEGMSPANELRAKIWEGRYGKVDSQDVDYFIRGWMNLFMMKTYSKGLFAKRKIARQVADIEKDWKFDLCKEYGEIGEDVLYEELFNMSRVYLSLCRKDKNYGSLIMGLGHMKEDSLVYKISKDIYTMAYEIPKGTGTVEEFALFTKAATDAFCAEYDSEKDILLDQIKAGEKN